MVSEKFQKNDFIEIEFTGKIKDGNTFDSNIKEEVKIINPDADISKVKPFIFSLGQNMFIQGVDEFLIGKTTGEYKIELSPDKAFGNRSSQLVQTVPMKVFQAHKLNPAPGAVFNFDGRFAKILSVSGGRVIVDFNHPLAGKNVIYDVKVLRKIEDLNERIKSFLDFLFRKNIKFEAKDKKLVIELDDPQISMFISAFKDKFMELFELELEVKSIEKPEKQTKTEDKTPKTSQ